MNKRALAMKIRLFLILFCIVMAALSFAGVGTLDEPHGRLVFGLLWICVGVLAVIRYLMERRRELPPPDEP